MCVCVCVCERERESEKEREKDLHQLHIPVHKLIPHQGVDGTSSACVRVFLAVGLVGWRKSRMQIEKRKR